MSVENFCEDGMKKLFAWGVTGIFFALGIWGVLHHEPWRDELQPWLLGRDFHSVWSLIAQARYEGHPSLWHLMQFFLSRVWNDPLAMQILHVVIASTAIFLFTKFSPFTILQKILFAFSYFFFYEFLIISRDYALGWLLLTIYTILLFRPKTSYWTMALLLVLMCSSNAMIFLVSCSLALFLFGDEFLNCLRARRWPSVKVFAPYVFFIAGVIFALWQLIPQPDCAIYPGIPARETYFNFDLLRVGHIMEAIVGVFLPLQDLPSSYFWSSNLLLSALERWLTEGREYWILASIIGSAILGATMCFFITRPKALRVYVVGSFVLLAFFYFKYYGGLRHVGHLVLLFVYCLWMAYKMPVEQLPSFVPASIVKVGEFFDRKRALLVTLFAAFHAVAGVYAYTQDLERPFTAAREAVVFAKTLDPKIPLTGAPDYVLTAFPAYLNRPVYYLDSLRYGTYIHWDGHRKALGFTDTIERLSTFVKDQGECILVLNYDLYKVAKKIGVDTATFPFECKELAHFDNTSIPDEMYFFYEIKKRADQSSNELKEN